MRSCLSKLVVVETRFLELTRLPEGQIPQKKSQLHLNCQNPLSDAKLDPAQQSATKIAASLHH